MRTANNNFTVEALVAKYHNYVKEHCSKRLDLVRDENGNFVELSTPSSPSGDAGPQLLITLYSMVAGENAKRNIVEPLSKYSSAFFKEALTSDELAYLCEHFREAVSYEFSHQDEWIAGKKIISETPEYIKDMCKSLECVNSKKGDRIYIEDDTLGDVAVLFPLCVILCDGYYDGAALKRIRLFAEGIQYEDVYDLEKESIDLIVAGFGNYPTERDSIELYDALAAGGTMVARFHFIGTLVARINQEFREGLVANKHILSIKKSSVMEEEDLLLESLVYTIVIEKKEHSVVEIIDETSNLSKKIDSTKLSAQILLPGYYLVERPENGIPLSDLIGYYNHDYAEDRVSLEQPIIFPRDLGCSFKDADISYREFKKGTDYGDIEHNPAQDCYSVDFPSILLYGNSKNIYAGIVSKREVPYAVLSPIACFTAKEGIDLRYAASLLYDPMVAKQITSLFEDFCLLGSLQCMSEFLDIIIVPRYDDVERSKYLADACYNALNKAKQELLQQQESYKKAIRMRKHALTQSISSIEAMFNALNTYRIRRMGVLSDGDVISRVNGTKVQEAFEFIAKGIKEVMPALDHIADVEFSFRKPEWIDPEKYIENYISQKESGWLNFKPIITWSKGHNQAKEDIKNPNTGNIIFKKGDSICQFLFSEDALNHVFRNIISNAQYWAFNNPLREDYQLKFSWHLEDSALIIEIENNGTPIPSDRDTASLLKYGVSTALHQDGHNGIGCNEIEFIMQRYKGNFEIVSTPENKYTVRYVLRFYHTNKHNS